LSNKQQMQKLIDILLAQLVNHEEMLRLAKKKQVTRGKVILAGGNHNHQLTDHLHRYHRPR